MMQYKYEMHQHTWPCSHCGHAEPEGLVAKMAAAGYAGCVLTDHFYHGNSGIDRGLPWAEFCRGYEENYRRAKAAAEGLDFDVLFGLEEHVGNGKEVLLYGITPDFMYSCPELVSGALETLTQCAHRFGALVIQAHPFRDRDYIPDPDLLLDPALLDGFEIWNAGNPEAQDLKAVAYAEKIGGILTAGSDCHREAADHRYGIQTAERIRDEAALVRVLRSGAYSIFREAPGTVTV